MQPLDIQSTPEPVQASTSASATADRPDAVAGTGRVGVDKTMLWALGLLSDRALLTRPGDDLTELWALGEITDDDLLLLAG